MKNKRVALVGFDRRTCSTMEASGINVVTHIFANPYDKSASFPKEPHLINFHDWSDYNHLFSHAFDDACNWLLKHKPDVVVYSNVPHQGMAVVNFYTAIALGIETRIFIQSPFEGKSWLIDHWNDFGTFKSSTQGEAFEIDISRPNAPPFYMNSVKSIRKRSLQAFAHKARARTIIGLGLTVISNRVRRRNFQRNMGRWQKAVENECYLKNVAKFFKDRPEDERYVYFPLHLQPEMTTDILGGDYADQVLALEQLRILIPDDIAIYVKENPKQTGRLRGEAFFDRLSKIPGRRNPYFPPVRQLPCGGYDIRHRWMGGVANGKTRHRIRQYVLEPSARLVYV